MVAATLVAIKIILYCFAIWGLVHYQWLDAGAFVLIGELLGWLGKNLAELSKAESKKVVESMDFDYLITGNVYEVYSNEDDSLIHAGKLLSVNVEGLKFENYFLPSKDYKLIYLV